MIKEKGCVIFYLMLTVVLVGGMALQIGCIVSSPSFHILCSTSRTVVVQTSSPPLRQRNPKK